MLRYTRPGGGKKFFLGTLKNYGKRINPHTIQELKDNISHAAAAIKITMLGRVYLNMIRRAQLCIDTKATTCNNFYDGISFQQLTTVLISVFTLCYGPGLLFRGPFCIKCHCDNTERTSKFYIAKNKLLYLRCEYFPDIMPHGASNCSFFHLQSMLKRFQLHIHSHVRLHGVLVNLI